MNDTNQCSHHSIKCNICDMLECVSQKYITAPIELNLCYTNCSYNGQDIEIHLDGALLISISYRYKRGIKKKRESF